jgi:hypothetical protein
MLAAIVCVYVNVWIPSIFGGAIERIYPCPCVLAVGGAISTMKQVDPLQQRMQALRVDGEHGAKEQLSAADARESLRRILDAHAAHALPVEPMYADTSIEATSLSDDERLQSQRAAFADCLRFSGLAGVKRTIVEFGAGDGALSRALRSAGAAGDFLLIDRSKKRMSRALAATESDGCDSVPMRQLCSDVGALAPEALREAAPDDCVVVVSNHLCGGALDAALRVSLDGRGQLWRWATRGHRGRHVLPSQHRRRHLPWHRLFAPHMWAALPRRRAAAQVVADGTAA